MYLKTAIELNNSASMEFGNNAVATGVGNDRKIGKVIVVEG
jgi:hypothetical protein